VGKLDEDTQVVDAPPRSALTRTATRAGRYQLLEEIDRGGMGSVHLGYDLDLDRKVAIKLMHGGGGADRLLREAQALARLSHPNVVTVHEVGLEGADVFVAMEFVEGPTLSKWRKRPRTWREVLNVFIQAGRGLAAAHGQGLVHRDFKPANVIVGADGRVRVLDFGLARSAEAGPESQVEKNSTDVLRSGDSLLSLNITAAGQVMGTPAYMAPEQFGGLAVDGRTDQFSFCVALHEVLYGERPFEGQTAKELAQNVRLGRLRPEPSGRDVPAWIRRVILRGLRVAPGERWPSMEALLAELGRDPAARRRRALLAVAGVGLLAGATSLARFSTERPCLDGDTRVERAWNEARATELAGAFEGAAPGYGDDIAARADTLLGEYAVQWTAMYADACEATHVRGDQSERLLDLRMNCLERRLDELDALVEVFLEADVQVVHRSIQAAAELPAVSVCGDVERLTAALPPPEDPAVAKTVSELRRQLIDAAAQLRAGRYSDGVTTANEVVAAARQLDYPPILAEGLLTGGLAHAEGGDYEAAETMLDEAFWIAAGGTDEVVAAEAARNLFNVVGYMQGRPKDAGVWEQHARVQVKRLGGGTRLEAMLLSSQATQLSIAGEHEAAREHLERALEIQQSLAKGPDLAVAAIYNNLGNVVSGERRFDEALDFALRALAIEEEILGVDHPEVSNTLENLGSIQLEMSNTHEAKQYYERALRIRERTIGPDHPRTAGTINNLGVIAKREGDPAAARLRYEQALAAYERSLGPDHPQVALSLSNVANAMFRDREYPAAKAYRERALGILEGKLGTDHPALFDVVEGLGDSALMEEDFELAVTQYERALGLKLPEENKAYSQFGLAQALDRLQRDPKRARELATAARGGLAADVSEAEKLREVDVWLAARAEEL
jgi:tetratricopeptide (TPR) repeat protein/predicted Ser/Thr protein kinase